MNEIQALPTGGSKAKSDLGMVGGPWSFPMALNLFATDSRSAMMYNDYRVS